MSFKGPEPTEPMVVLYTCYFPPHTPNLHHIVKEAEKNREEGRESHVVTMLQKVGVVYAFYSASHRAM